MALNQVGKQKLSKEMEKHKFTDAVELKKIHIENKNRFRNLERCMNIQRREREMADNEQKIKEGTVMREKNLEREETLARELDKIKREEFKDLKLRQSLRENCHELRDLESKLRAAYVSKELAAQCAEKEAQKLKKKMREKETYKRYQEVLRTKFEVERQEKEEELRKKTLYRLQLQDQMIVKEKQKRYLYEEFLREKKMIDDIVQRIHAEDEREIEEKMCRMKRTREEMLAFKKAQQIWRTKQKDEIEQENKRIQEYLMKKAIEMQSQEEKKNEIEGVKAKLTETIAKKLQEEEMRRKEREEIVQELYEEQQKQATEQAYRDKVEKEIRQRLEIRQSLDRQMAERQDRKKQDAQADAKYKEELIAKMTEDERLEQLSAQKRRMKMLQLRRDVEQMMIDRRQKRAEEMQLLMKLKEAEEMEAERRRRIIEEERLRMLKEHAKNLIGYLPRGVLRPDDLPHLGSDMVYPKD